MLGIGETIRLANEHHVLFTNNSNKNKKILEHNRFVEHLNKLHIEGFGKEKMSYTDVLENLNKIGIISSKTFKDMTTVVKTRNKMAHSFGDTKNIEGQFANTEKFNDKIISKYL